MTDGRGGQPADFFGGRARLLSWPAVTDDRGALLPIAFADLPFTPCRVFAVSDAQAGAVRGGHAHRSGMQLLICLQGRLAIELRTAKAAAALTLTPGGGALLIAPGVWCRQTYMEAGTVLLALASEPYDPASYIDQPFDPA
jgi:dTDP-4-dehydrorhamnose 3,5-epimerase-like enzyme